MSHHQDLVKETLQFWLPKVEIWENYRPEWLKGMEIDLYLPKYWVGIEVQGRQHTCWTPDFQETFADFKQQQRRDELKKYLCKQMDVILVELDHSIDLNRGKIESFCCKRKILGIRRLPKISLDLKQKWSNYNFLWKQLEQHRLKQVIEIKKAEIELEKLNKKRKNYSNKA